MGQYYTPVLVRLNKKSGEKEISTFNSRDFDNGCKLMEHSYIRNHFTETVCRRIYNNPAKVAWVGDYAEEYLEDLSKNGQCGKTEKLRPFVDIEGIKSQYNIKPTKTQHNCIGLYLYNLDKKELVDCYEFFARNVGIYGGCHMCVHPLPLLTAVGNGYGGGDYRNLPCEDQVGRWAGDEIMLAPYKEKLFKEFKDITEEINWKREEY